MSTNVSHSVEGFYMILHVFTFFCMGHQGHLRRPLVLRDRSSHTGRRWDNAGRCIYASGTALAPPEGRAGRLLDLTANEERTTRGGAGADPESEILGIFENSGKPSIFKVLCFACNFDWMELGWLPRATRGRLR